jgi:RHS repeat-associated protein
MTSLLVYDALTKQSTGLDYLGLRYMSPAQGRFTSPDPNSAGASLYDPQSWNAYSYVNNRPLAYVDPDADVAVPAAIVGGVAGGAVRGGFELSRQLCIFRRKKRSFGAQRDRKWRRSDRLSLMFDRHVQHRFIPTPWVDRAGSERPIAPPSESPITPTSERLSRDLGARSCLRMGSDLVQWSGDEWERPPQAEHYLARLLEERWESERRRVWA